MLPLAINLGGGGGGQLLPCLVSIVLRAIGVSDELNGTTVKSTSLPWESFFLKTSFNYLTLSFINLHYLFFH